MWVTDLYNSFLSFKTICSNKLLSNTEFNYKFSKKRLYRSTERGLRLELVTYYFEWSICFSSGMVSLLIFFSIMCSYIRRYTLIYVKPGSHLGSLSQVFLWKIILSHSNFWNLTWYYRNTSNINNDELKSLLLTLIFRYCLCLLGITFRLSKEVIWDHRLILSHQLLRLFIKAIKPICYKVSSLKYNRLQRIVI